MSTKPPLTIETRSKSDGKPNKPNSNAQFQTPPSSPDPLLRKMDEYFAKLNKKLDDSVNRLDNKFDNKIDQLRVDLKDDIKNDLLPRIEQNTMDITAATNRVSALEATVRRLENSIELQAKENELIVRGVPLVIGENCQRIYQTLAQAVGYSPESIPTADAFRLRVPRAGAPPILVKFAFKLDKTTFHNKYFRKKNLNLTDLGYEAAARVYVAENLTKKNQQIFGAAMKLKKEGALSSVSTHYGIVSVTKTQGGGRTTIRDLADLDSFHSEDD